MLFRDAHNSLVGACVMSCQHALAHLPFAKIHWPLRSSTAEFAEIKYIYMTVVTRNSIARCSLGGTYYFHQVIIITISINIMATVVV